MGAVTGPRFQRPGNVSRNAGWKAFPDLPGAVRKCPPAVFCSGRRNCLTVAVLSVLWLLSSFSPLYGREQHRRKPKAEDYGHGVSTEIASPQIEVTQAVEDVVNDGIIQGSKEYNKDKYIESASPVDSTPLFPEWKGPGTAYYKVRTGVLAPLNFKDSNDEGTLAVRYIVQSKDPSKTIVRIDAVFVEDSRRTVHASDGSVENAEAQDIHDRVDAVEAAKKQVEEGEKQRQAKLTSQTDQRKKEAEVASALTTAETSAKTLDERVLDLRHQAERVIKAPGGQLKSAPFHSATTVKSLEAGAEVVILVVTPYWYGVETTDGQHGWVNHNQLELLP